MSRISSCASCHGDILIPGHAQPQDQMRCPLCSAPFRVQDVLSSSILAPPEAIPLPRPVAGVAGASSGHAGQPMQSAELDAESIPPRPRKKQPGVLSHLIGVVGGGLIGLSLGYLGLLRFGGPRYDFLEIADKLPPWVTAPIHLPFLQGKAKSADEGAGERGLTDLLKQPDAPPAVEVPNPPPGGPADGVTSPFDTAPPFTPVAPPAPFPDSDPPPASDAAAPPATAAPPPVSTEPTSPPPMAGATPQQPAQTGPQHFTAYSAEDLALATADMASALRCPACDGTGYAKANASAAQGPRAQTVADRKLPCHECGGKATAKMTPELYARLCHLAEVVTFVSRGDTNTWGQRDTVQQLLASVGADARGAESIGRLAGFQLEPHRHHPSGIALAGTVQEMSQVGSLYAMKVVLFGLPKVVTVVSWRPAQPAINVHDRVIILGSIVDNPAENLVGYEGRQDQVVWGGLPAKLPPQP
ncbi:MAG TPA: hypothetical protein VHD36_02595 [Pirellulales bacterium]|nr:hypothetical protein [Pirellulales bacterium]